jgi:hypothetical protein
MKELYCFCHKEHQSNLTIMKKIKEQKHPWDKSIGIFFFNVKVVILLYIKIIMNINSNKMPKTIVLY